MGRESGPGSGSVGPRGAGAGDCGRAGSWYRPPERSSPQRRAPRSRRRRSRPGRRRGPGGHASALGPTSMRRGTAELAARMGSKLPFISVWAVMASVLAVRSASGASAAGGTTPRRAVRPGRKRKDLSAAHRPGDRRRRYIQLPPARRRYPRPIHGNSFRARRLS